MGGVPGEVVPFAVATAVSPLPLVVLLVVLLTPRAVSNGLALTAGWATALVVVAGVGVTLVATGAAPQGTGGAIAVLEVLAGVLLLALALQQWRGRPRAGAEAVVPGWLLMADRAGPLRAFLTGAVLILANPKNLTLTVAVAGAVAAHSTATSDRATALVLFGALGSAGLVVPLAIRIVLGDRATPRLTTWRRWLMVHGTPGACVMLVVVGVALVARGLTG